MKNQALFSLKDKSKKLKCRLLQFLFSTLRVKNPHYINFFFVNWFGFNMLKLLYHKLSKYRDR